MGFNNIKLLNESFLKAQNTQDTSDIITLGELDSRINECVSKIHSIKEQYNEVKANWTALCEDVEAINFTSSVSRTALTESFNKAIKDLKMEYEDTKATLDFYKQVKNKVLTEAEIRLGKDQLFDPNTPIDLKKLAIDADLRDKQAIADAKKAEEKKAAQAKGRDLLNYINNEIDEEDPEDFFYALVRLLVPDSGKAETQAGEIVRAMNRLLYRDYNDGDKFYEGYGLETCAPAAAFLMENGYWDDFELIVNNVTGDERIDEDRYTEALNKIRDKISQDVQNIDLLSEPAEMDMWDSDIRYIKDNQPRYETQVWVSDAIMDHVEAGHVDAWELIDYIEEAISWDGAYEGAEVERPWGRYDTEFTVRDLTIDGKEELEHMMKHNLDGFWYDLVQELNEKYPEDDEDEDEDYNDDEDDYNEDDEDSGDDDEDLDEAFLVESVLMETGDEDLLELFFDFYEKSSMKARADKILDGYREYEDELPQDLFKKASTADQERIIELLQK